MEAEITVAECLLIPMKEIGVWFPTVRDGIPKYYSVPSLTIASFIVKELLQPSLLFG